MNRITWLALVLVPVLFEVAGAAAPGAPEPERAIALPVWEGLTERFQDDLGRFAALLRTRNFEAAQDFFAKSFHGEVSLGGEAKADKPTLWSDRVTWKRVVKGKPVLVDAAASLSPLAELLKTWKIVDHATFTVPQALFYDKDGKTGAARVVLAAGGRDASDRPVGLTLQWDLCLRGEKDRFRFDCLTMRTGEMTVAAAPLFVDATAESGLGKLAAAVDAPTTEPARGVTAGDADGDGRADLFIPGPRGGLLLARDGKLETGKLISPTATSALLVDLDNDGDQDLVVGLATEPGLELHENFGGGFRPARPLPAGPGVQGLAAADFDGDGFLDLYASRSPDPAATHPDSYTAATNGLPGRLFLQVGPLAFRECAAERGLGAARWGHAAAAADADADGDTDLFVTADFGPDSYFENDGGARFTDRAAEVGVADGGRGTGAEWGDWDGDGAQDLLVSGSSSTDAERILGRLFGARPAEGPGVKLAALADGNGLFLRRRTQFQDIRRRSGVASAGWAAGAGFLDVDNDGRLDVFSPAGGITANQGAERESRFWRHVAAASLPVPASVAEKPGDPAGMARVFEPVRSGQASLAGGQRDRLFWNAGKAAAIEISALSGADHPGDGRAAAFLDHELDGDTDIVVHDRNGPRLLKNTAASGAGWLRLVLAGTESNRDGIGARVRVRAGKRSMVRMVSCGSGFASAHDRTLLIGLDIDRLADSVDVYWPSGVIEHYGPFPARSSQRLVEGNGELGPAKFAPSGIRQPTSMTGSTPVKPANPRR